MKKLVIFLLCCLSTICVKSQQWEIFLPTDSYNVLLGGDITTDGNYVISIDRYDGALYYPTLYYIDQNGNYISKRIYTEGVKKRLTSIITLDNGNAFVVGISNSIESQNDKYDSLWTMIINPELDIVFEKSYPLEGIYISYGISSSMTFANDGNIVMVTGITENEHSNEYPYSFDYALYKFDQQGNMMYHNYVIDNTVGGVTPFDIIPVPQSDRYMILGRGLNPLGRNTICIIDDDFNYISYGSMPVKYFGNMTTDVWADDDHFIMSTYFDLNAHAPDDCCLSIALVDTTAYINREIRLNKVDTLDKMAEISSMTYVNDSTIYVAAYWTKDFVSMNPNTATIYLIDKNMNLLGKKDLWEDNASINLVYCQKTFDDGCLIHGAVYQENGNGSIIWKLKREEFEVYTMVKEVPEEQLLGTAFPNPTSEVLNISIQNVDMRNARILITDISGKKCLDKEIKGNGNQLSVNVSNLGSGTYCYQIIEENQNVLSGTFVKK